MLDPRGLVDSYRASWQEAERGHWFLIAGFIFATRILAFSVAFPLFAKARGFDSSQIGLLLAATQISLFAFGIPIAMLGGRDRARPALIAGPLIAATGILLILLAPGDAFAPAALGCFLAGMASNVFWVLGDPILAGTVEADHRARVFALKFAILTVGFSLGGLLGGWIPAILERLGASDTGMYAGALVMVMVLDLVQSFCYGKMPRGKAAPNPARGRIVEQRARFTGLAFCGILILLIVPEMGMAIGYNSIRPYLSLFFDEEYGLSSGATGTAISLMQLAGGIGALLIPSLALKLGPPRTMALLRVIGGASILLALGASALPVVLLLILVHYSIVDGTEATYIYEAMNRLPISQRTMFSAVAAGAWSLCSALATSVSGYLQDETGGFGVAFGVGAIAFFVSAAWLLGVFPRIPSLFTPQPGAENQSPQLVPATLPDCPVRYDEDGVIA